VTFQISALARDRFTPLFPLSTDTLAARHIKRCVADQPRGFPCRVSLREASVGERVLLLSYEHQPADSPYRASGPIYVREDAVEATLAPNDVPDILRTRILSVRAYDDRHLMPASDVVDGTALETVVERLFADERVRYLHVHLAKAGCYACRIDRA